MRRPTDETGAVTVVGSSIAAPGFSWTGSVEVSGFNRTLAAARMSSARISPPGPEPFRLAISTPCSCASRRALGDTKSEAGKRLVVLPGFLRTDLRRHLDWYAEKGPDGLLFVGEKGKPFRRSTFGRKWRRARALVGMPDGFRFYDLRHTGHTLATRSGATLKDTMVRAGQSSEKSALIYQHSDLKRQQEVANGLDQLVRAARQKGREGPSGADLVQDA